MSAASLSRFRTVVIVVNIIAATMALANIAAMSTRVVEVEPLDETMVWSLDIIEKRMLMQAEVNIKNNALYDIRDISIDARLYLEDGTHILHYRRMGMVVPSVSNQALPFIISVALTEGEVQRMSSLLVLDDVFFLDMYITATYLWGFGEFRMDQTFAFQWTSPFKSALLEFLLQEGHQSFIEGALESMDSGDISDFFQTIGSPEMDAAFKLVGIAATVAEVDVGNETTRVTLAVDYEGVEYLLGIMIPLSEIMLTEVSFEEGSYV